MTYTSDSSIQMPATVFMFDSVFNNHRICTCRIWFRFSRYFNHNITLWIVSALWGGLHRIKRLKMALVEINGHGYFWGMITGIAASMILPEAFPSIPAIMAFPYILVISLIGCIIGSLLTNPSLTPY